MARATTVTLRYPLAVVSRTTAGVAGGYGLAAITGLWTEWLLPLPASDGVLVSNMLFFVVFAAAVMWTFSASSAARAWIGIGAPAALLALLLFALTGGAWL